MEDIPDVPAPPKVDGRGRNLTPEQRRRTSQAGGAASMAKLTSEERKQRALHAAAKRELKRADAKAMGDSTEWLSPEQRQQTAAAGGRARVAALTPDERKEWAAKGNKKALEVLEVQRMAFGTIGRDKFIQLPRSSPVNKPHTFLKLIQEIQEGPGGFGWKGRPFRPGSKVTQSQLRPDRTWPAAPLLLECGGACGPGGEYCWILWTLRAGEWLELGRCQAEGSEWTFVLDPLAKRVLQLSPPPRTDDFLRRQFDWIRTWLDRRIMQIPKPARLPLLEWLYDDIASRAAVELPNLSDVVIEASPSGD